ncbi:MAG: ribosome maturation factor RimP [Lachnospiraceae bacterium]|nr:ribosome maturation factor RimP [Lachnospiraceae bacterium]
MAPDKKGKGGAGRAQIAGKAERIAAPIAEKHGMRIYDVEYEKQDEDYALCIYIDKDGGVTINDCEAVSREISDRLDEEDFIQDAYTLIVSSPGLGRKLTKDRHLSASIGEAVEVKGYKDLAGKGVKEVEGILLSFDEETVTLDTGTFLRKDIATIRLQIDF